jgi:hypothetical protein
MDRIKNFWVMANSSSVAQEGVFSVGLAILTFMRMIINGSSLIFKIDSQ